MRVNRISPNVYKYSYFVRNVNAGKASFSQLVKLVRRFFRKKNFIIQKAILLPKNNGKKIDLRAEMQRNGNGDLIISGISVREGVPGSPITTHARSYRINDFFTHFDCAGLHNSVLERNFREFLFRTYSAVEAGYGIIGEMGIDFALDTEGKLWFIECNSQPTKVSLLKAYDDETVRQVYVNTLAYACYLAQS
jgi:hypothetical protein